MTDTVDSRSSARSVEVADHWERIALGRLMADMRVHQSNIAAAALSIEGAVPGADCINKWAERNSQLTRRADKLIEELRAGGPLTVSKLAVASSHLTLVAR